MERSAREEGKEGVSSAKDGKEEGGMGERTSLFWVPWLAQLTLTSVSKIFRPLRVWRAVSADRRSMLKGDRRWTVGRSGREAW